MKLKHRFQTADNNAANQDDNGDDTAEANATPAAADADADADANNADADADSAPAPTATATASGADSSNNEESAAVIQQPEKKSESAKQEEDKTVHPQSMFWIGLALLAMFVAYFAVENPFKKRMVGTLLAAGVSALALFYFGTYKVDLAIDLAGGSQFVVEIQKSGEAEITSSDQDDVINTFQKRLDPDGTKNLIISPQGTDRIIIQMPGISEEERKAVEQLILKTAKTDIVLVHDIWDRDAQLRDGVIYNDEVQPILGAQVVGGYGEPKDGEKPLRPLREIEAEEDAMKERGEIEEDEMRTDPRYNRIIVQSGVSVSGELIDNARSTYGPRGWQINVNLNAEGGKKMSIITTENIGRRMAILVDGQNVSAPQIGGAFAGSFEITGTFTQEETEQLATMLKNPLRKPVKIIQQSSVSPQMGEESIKQGLTAGIAGLALTLIFVLLYYNFAGVVATVGLTLNIVLIFGVLAIMDTAISMPGIAGIILTIGIAIDANVLIYERLREEQAAGKSIKLALNTAYGKAFSAIFDANITTLIAAIVLFIVAAGTVKGFSVTLMVGVVGTLFAALLVTRTCFAWLTAGKGLLKALPLGTNPFIALIVTLVIGAIGFTAWRTGGITAAIVVVVVLVTGFLLIESKVLGGKFSLDLSKVSFDFLSKRRIALFVSIGLLIVAVGVIGSKRSDALAVELKEGDQVVFLAPSDVTQAAVAAALSSMDLKTPPAIQEQTNVLNGKKYISMRVDYQMGDEAKDHVENELDMAFEETDIQSVGPVIGKEMLQSSAMALGIALLCIMLYVTFRFESFAFALGAIVALVHDLIIVAGLVIFFGREVSLIMVGALLTIAGYSINDTIVVFDRVREGLKTRRGDVKDVMNFCLNATLSRTLLTSLTTLIVVVTLFVFGGPSLNDFALTLMIGVLIGTYSSIFVASPIVLWWSRKFKLNLRKEVLDREQAKVSAGNAPA